MERNKYSPYLACVLLFMYFTPCTAATPAEHWIQSTRVESVISLTGEPVTVGKATTRAVRDPDRAVPESEWLRDERQHFLRVLRSERADVLVVPAQLDATGISEPLRALFGMLLSDRFERTGADVLQSQFTLLRAFGGSRSIPLEQIWAVADGSGVTRIVEPYLGFHRISRTSFELLLTVREHSRDQDNWNMRVSSTIRIPFDLDGSPVEVYDTFLQKISSWLQLGSPPVKSEPQKMPRIHDFGVPLGDLAGTMDQVTYLQMLGATTPHIASRKRAEYFTRSLFLMLRTGDDSGRFDALMARAYHELKLHALASATLVASPQQHCYLEYLRANLERLSNCARQAPEWQRPLLALDALTIARIYQTETTGYEEEVYETLSRTSGWVPYFHSFISGYDTWTPSNSAWIKRELDLQFPIDGYSIENVKTNPTLSVEELDRVMKLSPIRHYRLLRDNGEVDFWRSGLDSAVSRVDRLEYLKAHALEHIYREGDKVALRQALGQSALDYVQAMETQLNGHPMVAFLKAAANRAMVNTASPDEREHYYKQAYEFGCRAYYWEQDQTEVADRAGSLVSYIRQPYLRQNQSYWLSDYPVGVGYLSTPAENLDHYPLSLNKFKEAVAKRMERNLSLDELENYFIGHPLRDQSLIEPYMQQRKWEAALPLARQQLEAFPDQFKNYQTVAEILFRTGKFDEAAEVYAAYPPFVTIATSDHIEHSNNVASIAVDFSIVGRHDLARKFLELSEKYRTFSAANLAALGQLEYARGNVPGALAYAEANLSRYGHAGAIAAYFMPLAAMGYAEDVLTYFDNYVATQNSMVAWLPAHVAQRVLGWQPDEVLGWLDRSHFSNSGINRRLMLNHYIREITTDRPPITLDYERLREDDPLKVVTTGPEGILWEVKVAPEQIARAKPGDEIEGVHPADPTQTMTGKVFAGELEQYLELDLLVKQEEFTKAYSPLQDYRNSYGVREHSILLAAQIFVENKDLAGLAKLIGEDNRKRPFMQMDLARALNSAANGEHALALQYIDRALGHTIGTGDRYAFSPYLVARALYYLTQKYGDAAYRQRTLDWARSSQASHRYHAWPYSLEAVLAPDSAGRDLAAAKALHLDRQSFWLKKVPQEVRRRAEEILDRTNPFVPELAEEVQEDKS